MWEKDVENKLPLIAHLHMLKESVYQTLYFLSASESDFCFNYPVKERMTTVVTFFALVDKKLSFNLK